MLKLRVSEKFDTYRISNARPTRNVNSNVHKAESGILKSSKERNLPLPHPKTKLQQKQERLNRPSRKTMTMIMKMRRRMMTGAFLLLQKTSLAENFQRRVERNAADSSTVATTLVHPSTTIQTLILLPTGLIQEQTPVLRGVHSQKLTVLLSGSVALERMSTPSGNQHQPQVAKMLHQVIILFLRNLVLQKMQRGNRKVEVVNLQEIPMPPLLGDLPSIVRPHGVMMMKRQRRKPRLSQIQRLSIRVLVAKTLRRGARWTIQRRELPLLDGRLHLTTTQHRRLLTVAEGGGDGDEARGGVVVVNEEAGVRGEDGEIVGPQIRLRSMGIPVQVQQQIGEEGPTTKQAVRNPRPPRIGESSLPMRQATQSLRVMLMRCSLTTAEVVDKAEAEVAKEGVGEEAEVVTGVGKLEAVESLGDVGKGGGGVKGDAEAPQTRKSLMTIQSVKAD